MPSFFFPIIKVIKILMNLFIVLMVLSISLFIGGYYFKLPFIRYIGLMLLFLTGVGVLDGLQYQTDTIVDTAYTYDSNLLISSQDTIVPQYGIWGETNLGFMIISISVFTLILDFIFTQTFKHNGYGNDYE